jgi:hypothetical protein
MPLVEWLQAELELPTALFFLVLIFSFTLVPIALIYIIARAALRRHDRRVRKKAA